MTGHMALCKAKSVLHWPYARECRNGQCARHGGDLPFSGELPEITEQVAMARTLTAWRCPDIYDSPSAHSLAGPRLADRVEYVRDFFESLAMWWRLAQLRGLMTGRRGVRRGFAEEIAQQHSAKGT